MTPAFCFTNSYMPDSWVDTTIAPVLRKKPLTAFRMIGFENVAFRQKSTGSRSFWNLGAIDATFIPIDCGAHSVFDRKADFGATCGICRFGLEAAVR